MNTDHMIEASPLSFFFLNGIVSIQSLAIALLALGIAALLHRSYDNKPTTPQASGSPFEQKT